MLEDEESGAKEEMICVICMNAVRFDVNSSGSVVYVNNSVA